MARLTTSKHLHHPAVLESRHLPSITSIVFSSESLAAGCLQLVHQMDRHAAFDIETQQTYPPDMDNIKVLDTNSPKLNGVYAASANLFNLLNGIGVLSAAYAIQTGGYLSIIVFGLLAIMSGYSAHLLGRCMEASAQNGSQIVSYQEIAVAAFGLKGRYLVTGIFYCERILSMIGYTILLGSSLSDLFPHAALKIATARLNSYEFLSIVSILSILPVICARSMRFISFFSITGVVSILVVVGAVIIDRIRHYDGIHSLAALHSTNVPFAIGFYSCAICTNAVIPTIYRTMKDTSQFKKVIFISFSTTSAFFGGFAFLGALLYGQRTQSPITLSMVKHEIVWKLAVGSIILSSITKLPLNVSSFADEVEAVFCKWSSFTTSSARLSVRISVRCLFMIGILTLALSFPYFSEIISLTGSTLEILLSIVLPCLFYLKIYKASTNRKEIAVIVLVTSLGIVCGIVGTISSVEKLIERRRGKSE